MVGAAVENVAHEYAAIKQIGGEPLSFKELFKKSEDGEEDSAVALGALGVIYKHWPEKDITASDVYAYLSTTEAQFDDEEKATLRDYCQPKGKGPFTTTVTAKSISRALGNIGGMPVRCGDGMQLILKAGFIHNTFLETAKVCGVFRRSEHVRGTAACQIRSRADPAASGRSGRGKRFADYDQFLGSCLLKPG
jgi:hypothetical protein